MAATSSPLTSSTMPPLTIIVAAHSKHLGIGLKGSLPWRLKQEIHYFKRVTTYNPHNKTNAVIMGRKCWESIPPKFRPLPQRYNIILTRQAKLEGITEQEGENVTVASSLQEALEKARDKGLGRVFVIGGGEVYREAMMLKQCNRILFTEVCGEDVETDVDFPIDFRRVGGWERVSHEKLEKWVGGEVRKGEINEGNLTYEFQMWERDDSR